MKNKTAVVVLSGGQDSVTCLGLALKQYAQVHAISFEYNQKHKVELLVAQKVCKANKVELTIMTIPALAQLSDSALIAGSEQKDVNEKHTSNSLLPASFVPNRNALFLTTAHAFAQKVGADTIITGVCQTDYSGYPDCRQVFIDKLQDTLNVGYDTSIRIETPLMNLNKAQTFQLAEEVGFLETVLEDSHTCYNGDRSQRHEWGYGCNECPACKLRRCGYADYVMGDGSWRDE